MVMYELIKALPYDSDELINALPYVNVWVMVMYELIKALPYGKVKVN